MIIFLFRFNQLIFKVNNVKENFDDLMDDLRIFYKEMVCYRDILPKVNAKLELIGDSSLLAPICFCMSETTNPKYFVFEDLKGLGFANVSRQIGLNFDHLSLTVSKLAVWHASTAVLLAENPDLGLIFYTGTIKADVKYFHEYYTRSIRYLGEVVKTWQGLKEIGQKLIDLESKIIEKGCNVFTRQEGDFNVLNHGGLWMDNIMFRQDSDDIPQDVVFVDYSLGFYGSPGIDLAFLLSIFTTENLTDVHRDELISIYHENLIKYLKLFNYQNRFPSLIDIQVEVLKKSVIGLIYSSFIIPIRLIGNTESADIFTLMGNTEESVKLRQQLYSSPKLKGFIKNHLQYWNRKGILEV